MSGLIGSCCEEQEAQEAAAHAKYRKAVRASESRLLARSNLAARLQRSLRCPHGDGCREPECNDCEEEGEECEETGDLSALALGDDDDDESSDEESALQRMTKKLRGDVLLLDDSCCVCGCKFDELEVEQWKLWTER